MRVLETNICIGLGDILYIKGQIEPFKHQFDQIKISYDKRTITEYRANDPRYLAFLQEIGEFFFSDPPYLLNVGDFVDKGQQRICHDYNLPLIKPNLRNIMYRGASLALDEDYIVITTKIRSFPRHEWNNISGRFWNLMQRLSQRYRIVVLGERVVEMSKEYKAYGNNNVYCVYQDILSHIPRDRLIDLTIPALGITAPNLQQIQQDCVIMSDAKFVVMIGIGGAFCMATSVANTIGYRIDRDGLADALFNDKVYSDALITKNWATFSNRLEQEMK